MSTHGALPRDGRRGPRPPLPPRYRPIRQIATGGMGAVWAAEDELLRRQVAIKVLAENLAEQRQFVRRFEREARTAASLSGHPNVVTIYDVGEHEGRPFIVMELLIGGTVADRVRGGEAPPPRRPALEWLRQTASALDFAHERGVAHRDVKPANLLFDDRGRLVIADFGIARVAYEQTLTGSGELLGTGAYISPEQASGDAGDAASDRYSLAVVAYELLTGRRPFGGSDFVQQALQHIEVEPAAASDVAPSLPPAVDEVLARGLAKDPAERWPSASGFVEALAAAFGSPDENATPYPEDGSQPLAPLAAPNSAGPQAEPFAPRHARGRRLLPLALVALAAIVVGVLAASALTGDGDGTGDRRAARGDRGSTQRERAAGSNPRERAAPQAERTRGPADSAGAAQLNDQGFRLLKGERPAEAIPLLERAVAAFPENSNDLTYAYALYNLGRSLRLAGRPAEAIPLLERRLRIPNQRETVARELAAARRAADD